MALMATKKLHKKVNCEVCLLVQWLSYCYHFVCEIVLNVVRMEVFDLHYTLFAQL